MCLWLLCVCGFCVLLVVVCLLLCVFVVVCLWLRVVGCVFVVVYGVLVVLLCGDHCDLVLAVEVRYCARRHSY